LSGYAGMEFVPAVDAALAQSLDAALADCPATLASALRYCVLAPGKRLRPVLCGFACQAAGGTFAQSLKAGAAVEFVHTYSLVHDDLPAMDDDDLRRGRATCHKVYGDAVAILCGDALLTLAFEVLASGYSPGIAAVGCVELARGAGAIGMVAGQVLDLAAEGRIPGPAAEDQSHLENIHRRKTGALIRAALRLGVHVSESATPEKLRAADDYAAAFGLLFQVTDDLLDAEGDATKTGKNVGKDAGRGKLTYPGLLGVVESKRLAAELAAAAEAAAMQFGPCGQPLAELARYTVSRDR
jgi:geranylgeranyl diphosphate synthase, type II